MFARAAPAERCIAGAAIQYGDLQLRGLHPTAEDYARPRSTNAMSCVLEAQLGSVRVLLPGDLPARDEAELLARTPLAPFTWVAAPHHGSRHSSSAALVAATRPRWVLVQAGYRNRFGHPAPEVTARWASVGATLRRTDESGAVQWRLKADGSGAVRRTRERWRRYWHAPLQPLAPADADADAPMAGEEPDAPEPRSGDTTAADAAGD